MLVIFARPQFCSDDHNKIEAYRRQHDPQHHLVEAHFTLVFPCDVGDVQAAVAHAQDVSASTGSIPFRLTDVMAVKDTLSPLSHVFLTPSEGASDIHSLHDRLYAGPLARHLRKDIPYEPHVTIGAFTEQYTAITAANEFGVVSIPGRISAIEIADFDGKTLSILQRLFLR